MARVTYTEDQKLAAVALAEVSGAPAASEALGIHIETIRIWQREAKPSSALGRAVDLALATVTKRLASGKMRDRDAAVTYGILRDKAARYDKPPEVEDGDPIADPLFAWIDKTWPDPNDADLAVIAAIRHLDDLAGKHVQRVDLDEEAAALALAELEAWDFEAEKAYLLSLGDLQEWWERRQQEDHERVEAQLAANRKAAAAYQQRSLDEEAQALLKAAEVYLAQTGAIE